MTAQVLRPMGTTHYKEAVIEAQTPSPSETYHIKTGKEVLTVHGRDAAIEKARTLSGRSGRPISVERQDGRMTMQFSRGGVQTYRFETNRH